MSYIATTYVCLLENVINTTSGKHVIVIVIVIVILYSAGTYIYIMDEKSLKCDDALKDCWRNQQPKHKSLQNTTTKTHRYRTLRTFIART